MSSTVYELHSDRQFIRIWKKQPDDIYVYEYKGDPNASGLIFAEDSRWVLLALIGPSASSQFKALEVMGVTIGGKQLKELPKDLTFVDKTNGQTFHLLVNRQGLSHLFLCTQSVMWLRCNDRFGWSKYGVKCQSGSIWSICDMSNGDVLVDCKGDDGNEYLKKLLEEKVKEVASLKAAVRSLVGDHK